MESIFQSAPVVAIISIALLLLTVIRQSKIRKNRNAKQTKKSKPTRTLAVLGSGGHTTEMIRLLSSLNKENYNPLYYIVASTDTTSINRLNELCHGKHNEEDENSSSSSSQEQTTNNKRRTPPPHDEIFKIPRAREVGQSYITSVFSTVVSILSSAHIVLLKVRPDLLVINGPGTCIPIAFWTFVGRMLGVCEGRIIFCESFCRVNTLSLTGKLLLKFGMVDIFLVHWQELMDTVDAGYTSNNVDKATAACGVKFILIDSFIKHNES